MAARSIRSAAAPGACRAVSRSDHCATGPRRPQPHRISVEASSSAPSARAAHLLYQNGRANRFWALGEMILSDEDETRPETTIRKLHFHGEAIRGATASAVRPAT